METVAARLHSLITRYWQIPAPEAAQLLRVLQTSRCSRVRQMRLALATLDIVVPTAHGARETDAAALFRETLSPSFVIATVEDLLCTTALSRHQAQVIEEAVLGCVDAHGQWRVLP